MTRLKSWVTLVCLLCSCGLAARAQSDLPVRVTVPFDFYIGQSHFEPGTYVFTESQGILHVRNDAGDMQRMFASTSVFGKHDDKNIIEFTKIQEKLYLARIWEQGEESGHELALHQ